ncbi:M55 family metallopeptidase [bacterium]|nr:M55 family metallopeptidase [bacterium]
MKDPADTAYPPALVFFLLLSLLSSGCTRNSGGSRIIEDTRADRDGLTRILLYYDMEGLSGQDIITSIDFPRPEYFRARELLTADVNAVIEGLFAGGADSVFVVDAHGSFNPEPDILLEKMDRRARMLFKKERFQPYVDLLTENEYDGIVAVGMHSRTGGGGFGEHTVNLGTEWILNGMSINESEIIAYSWGRERVPLIFVSGDDKLAAQLSWMTWLEYVTVKEAVNINTAVLRPVDEVHAEMTAAARRAVEHIGTMKSAALTGPVTASLRVQPPADLSLLAGVPGIDYHDETVTFTADDFGAAYDGIRAFMRVAQAGYINIAAELFLGQGQDAFMQFKDAIFDEWQKAALEKSETPSQEQGASTGSERRYFGST